MFHNLFLLPTTDNNVGIERIILTKSLSILINIFIGKAEFIRLILRNKIWKTITTYMSKVEEETLCIV